jgi:MerR family transcriptional regulator, light-induced transcriptional regulator
MAEVKQPAEILGPPLTVAVVARRLGVAPATLRTWDRRYGLGPSEHNAGSRRRYSPQDVQRLELMRTLTLDGVTPADAAKLALSGEAAAPRRGGKAGGGRVLATPRGTPEVRGLARAAMALDAPAAQRIIIDHLARSGVCWTWDNVISPVLVAIGERVATTNSCIDVEHVLSAVVSGTLREHDAYPPGGNIRPVLLAAACEEQHTLPIEVLYVALAERGVNARLMGARTPSSALGDAVLRSGACAVFLWAHSPDVVCPHQWSSIPETRPGTLRVVGGPGWVGDLPEGVRRVAFLNEAVEVLTRSALGAGAGTG